ncbi:MAG: type II toxin-antitoxin system RelE/ParE family toxin [Alphaproteobacteria bacterium]
MILLSEVARTDIKSAYVYLNTESPKAARQLLNSIDIAFSMLMEFPNIGHERSDLTSYEVKFYSVQKYLIVYKAKTHAHIEIVRFLHGYQDLVSLL